MSSTNMSKIPFVDLVAQHRAIRNEVSNLLSTVLETGIFIGGPMVEGFEGEFAEFCDVKDCVAVSSGTDALRFALIAAGVMPGDIVVTSPHTFIATAEAISQAGAIPRFVDVDEATYTLDPEKLRIYVQMECFVDEDTGKLVTVRDRRPVSAVVPVHLYGQMADMDPILALAERYGLIVVEDACQAHGAEYFSAAIGEWKKAGSMGHAAAFSFYPGKNLGACGEGGAVTTNNQAIAKGCRLLRDHGQSRKYYHECEGYNGRLDALQAGILSIKLARLAEWNSMRRHHAKRYGELLEEAGSSVILPRERHGVRSVYHLYVIRVGNRGLLQRSFAEAGIGFGIHYPIPLHLQAAYAKHGFAVGDFPVTERIALEILSLPMFAELSVSQQDRVVEQVLAYCTAEAAVQ